VQGIFLALPGKDHCLMLDLLSLGGYNWNVWTVVSLVLIVVYRVRLALPSFLLARLLEILQESGDYRTRGLPFDAHLLVTPLHKVEQLSNSQKSAVHANRAPPLLGSPFFKAFEES
jgi:hypothetical protein